MEQITNTVTPKLAKRKQDLATYFANLKRPCRSEDVSNNKTTDDREDALPENDVSLATILFQILPYSVPFTCNFINFIFSLPYIIFIQTVNILILQKTIEKCVWCDEPANTLRKLLGPYKSNLSYSRIFQKFKIVKNRCLFRGAYNKVDLPFNPTEYRLKYHSECHKRINTIKLEDFPNELEENVQNFKDSEDLSDIINQEGIIEGDHGSTGTPQPNDVEKFINSEVLNKKDDLSKMVCDLMEENESENQDSEGSEGKANNDEERDPTWIPPPKR